MGPMVDTDEKSWDKIFDVNVKSHFFLATASLPHMPSGSSIIFVSSVGGFLPNPMLGAYSVSKTALISLTKVMLCVTIKTYEMRSVVSPK
jgi:dehydrogenase/reductase SDR family protein 4